MLGFFGRIAAWWAQRRHRQQRQIFKFVDGQRMRGVDPMLVLRSLTASKEFNAERHYQAALDGDSEAIEICCRAVCEAFGVKPFSDDGYGVQEGLTESECMQVLVTFSEYLDALKKNTSGQPTSPDALDQGASDTSATNLESDSGSTSDAAKCDEQPACSTP